MNAAWIILYTWKYPFKRSSFEKKQKKQLYVLGKRHITYTIWALLCNNNSLYCIFINQKWARSSYSDVIICLFCNLITTFMIQQQYKTSDLSAKGSFAQNLFHNVHFRTGCLIFIASLICKIWGFDAFSAPLRKTKPVLERCWEKIRHLHVTLGSGYF